MDYTDPLARTGQHLDDTLVILDDMRRTVEALDARLAALIDDAAIRLGIDKPID